MKPMFYLGALESRETYKGYTLIVSGREYARDLASQPAMSLGKTIFVRRESLRRMLWEKVEEWRWNKPVNAMQNALACYDFDNHAVQSLDAMTNNELRSVKLHEIGEVQAGELLGNEWQAMLAGKGQTKFFVGKAGVQATGFVGKLIHHLPGNSIEILGSVVLTFHHHNSLLVLKDDINLLAGFQVIVEVRCKPGHPDAVDQTALVVNDSLK